MSAETSLTAKVAKDFLALSVRIFFACFAVKGFWALGTRAPEAREGSSYAFFRTPLPLKKCAKAWPV